MQTRLSRLFNPHLKPDGKFLILFYTATETFIYDILLYLSPLAYHHKKYIYDVRSSFLLAIIIIALKAIA